MIGFNEDTTLPLKTGTGKLIRVDAGAVQRDGIFALPEQARGLVILAQGIEDAAHTPHMRAIALADILHRQGLATFVVDLFSSEEQELDRLTGYFHENCEIMYQRILGIADWFLENPSTARLSIGYFGMEEAGAASLIAAAERPDIAVAVVSAGGRVDLARDHLPRVQAPTLLIAAGKDKAMVERNQEALRYLKGSKQFEQVPGTASLVDDQQGQAGLNRLASDWFVRSMVSIF